MSLSTEEMDVTTSQNELKEDEHVIDIKDEAGISQENELESSTESSSTSSSDGEASRPPKRRRKRKRKRKNKSQTTTAYEPPEPFMQRYQNVKSVSIPPKIHIRFDDEGQVDEKKSHFNLRPRIVRALQENLKLQNPEFKSDKLTITSVIDPPKQDTEVELSLKPRIIKAIDINI